jgi:hypothetical protein
MDAENIKEDLLPLDNEGVISFILKHVWLPNSVPKDEQSVMLFKYASI